MLDAFTEVLVKHASSREQEDELTALMMQLPLEEVAKFASGTAVKTAYCGDDNGDWLKKYEGTNLFEKAIALEEELLSIEGKRIAKRMKERSEPRQVDDLYAQEDMVRLKKRMLDLDLHRSGIPGGSSGEAEETDELDEPDSDEKSASAERVFVNGVVHGFNKTAFGRSPEESAALSQYAEENPGKFTAGRMLSHGLLGAGAGALGGYQTDGPRGALIGSGIGAVGGAGMGLANTPNVRARLKAEGAKSKKKESECTTDKTAAAGSFDLAGRAMAHALYKVAGIDMRQSDLNNHMGAMGASNVARASYLGSPEAASTVRKGTGFGAAGGALLGAGVGALSGKGIGGAVAGGALGALGGGALGNHLGKQQLGTRSLIAGTAAGQQYMNQNAPDLEFKAASVQKVAGIGAPGVDPNIQGARDAGMSAMQAYQEDPYNQGTVRKYTGVGAGLGALAGGLSGLRSHGIAGGIGGGLGGLMMGGLAGRYLGNKQNEAGAAGAAAGASQQYLKMMDPQHGAQFNPVGKVASVQKVAFTPLHAAVGGLAGAYNAPKGHRLEGAAAGAKGATLGAIKGGVYHGTTGAAGGAAAGLLPAALTGGLSVPALATMGGVTGALEGGVTGGVAGYKKSMDDLRARVGQE